MVAELLEKGEEVVILDNFQKGHRDSLLGGKLYDGDLRDDRNTSIRFLQRIL